MGVTSAPRGAGLPPLFPHKATPIQSGLPKGRRPGPAGLFLVTAFFAAGAVYAATLNHPGRTGSCGCGVAPVTDSANPPATHAYQNTACAVLCLFLAIRARPGGETNEKSLQRT